MSARSCVRQRPARTAALASAAGAARPSARPAPRRRLRDGDFNGADAGAVEFLVLSGVRPAEHAAALLLAAQTDASPPRRLSFPGVRDVWRELRNAGARKPRLVAALAAHPGVLALPQPELRARLRALQNDAGLEEFYQLPRTLEKHLAVLACPPSAAAALSSFLRERLAVPQDQVGNVLFAAPQMLAELESGAVQARCAELAQTLELSEAQVGAAALAHPLLLCTLLGGTLADRLSFWSAEGLAVPQMRSLALTAPAALTASPTVLRRKAAFLRDQLGLSSAQAIEIAPSVFGELSLERTLIPRAHFLLNSLNVPREAAAAALDGWAGGERSAFLEGACAQLAPWATDEERSEGRLLQLLND